MVRVALGSFPHYSLLLLTLSEPCICQVTKWVPTHTIKLNAWVHVVRHPRSLAIVLIVISFTSGGSSGCAMMAAVKAAKKYNFGVGKKIVVILPDGIRNYMNKFVNDQWMESYLFLDPPSHTMRLVDTS